MQLLMWFLLPHFQKLRSSISGRSQARAQETSRRRNEEGFYFVTKLNFAGGEPFLYPAFMGQLAAYCKNDLNIESISIVSNGSLIKRHFFDKWGKYVDIIAISCDSFNEEVNSKIGRGTGKHISKLVEVRQMCRDYGIKFKLNTVVNRYNFDEDMNSSVEILDPFRWKCFQVLILSEENSGVGTIRDAKQFQISESEFQSFTNRHENQVSLVPESNDTMRNSYLILDEHLCFLNCRIGVGKAPSRSLLHVSVSQAMEEAEWDHEAFMRRGGVYEWQKKTVDGCKSDSKLDW